MKKRTVLFTLILISLVANYIYAAYGYVQAISSDSSIGKACDRKVLGYYDAKLNEDEVHSFELYRQYEREIENLDSYNKEVEMLIKNKIIKNQNENKLVFIKSEDLNLYPTCLTIYIDHRIEHLKVGDSVPAGVYVDEEKSILYIVSLSKNKVFEYKINN